MAFSLYTFLFAVTLTVLVEARNAKYCSVKTCGGSKHTTCLYSDKPSKTCGKVIVTGLTPAQIKEVVDVHNSFRKRVANGLETRGNPGPQPGSNNIGPLTWSDDIAEIAQVWANQCHFGHDACRDLPKSQVGQNVAISEVYGQEPKPITEMIASWYNEVKDFDRNMVSKFKSVGGPMIGHYTQLVWGNTKRVGCGFIRYNNNGPWISSYLVCNYDPSGNWIGQPIY